VLRGTGSGMPDVRRRSGRPANLYCLTHRRRFRVHARRSTHPHVLP
jgi:hypothetical protein